MSRRTAGGPARGARCYNRRRMTEAKITRRRFIKGLAAAGALTAAGAAGYGGLVGRTDYELTETDIFIRDLPPAFDGFRVAQVSDVHHSSLVGLDEVRRVVELANGARADMIALTGDYTTASRKYIEPCAEALSALAAPHGVWAVLGNHDHHTDGPATERALVARGIGLLDNANTRLRRGPDELQLVGIDDWSWAQNDWARAFKGVDRARPSVLLSHQPGVLDRPQTEGVSLILSGHTHGGQVSLPLVGAPARFVDEFKYLRGRFERERTQLYVTRGTGVIGLPVRLGARPEIAVLRLRRKE
ncbi:MAG: metallophosphoesterase [Acidobacteria bacterium]|nr:metallophosphoesterase [Acidobacteriota bacterium]